MTNKLLYDQIASKDVSELMKYISDDNTDSTEFADLVLRVSDTLGFLFQAIKINNKENSYGY